MIGDDNRKQQRPAQKVLLVSCYELGHQPLAVASAAAFLERAGFPTLTLDLAVQELDSLSEATLRRVGFVGLSVPMHTALRRGVGAAARLRRSCPEAHVCFFGLYALLNADYLLDGIADSVLGGELERALVEQVRRVLEGEATAIDRRPRLERLDFPPPRRDGLPSLDRYARLQQGGERRLAAAVEASRGCLHHCRHCPIPPLYAGRFFVVPRDVVLRDIDAVVRRGARHVSFADPDFLNGPGHALKVARALHREHPAVTFDFTAKIEHLLQHRGLLPQLRACGCLFVVSAVESLNDDVLTQLDKGHTRDDVFEAERLLGESGIALRPSLMPFSPWETLASYGELLDWIEAEGLIEHVDAVQLSIRLLVPPGSLLERHPGMRPHLRELDAAGFQRRWAHPDPRMDRLQREVEAIVRDAAAGDESGETTFRRIRRAHAVVAGRPLALAPHPARERPVPPRLTEPWFC